VQQTNVRIYFLNELFSLLKSSIFPDTFYIFKTIHFVLRSVRRVPKTYQLWRWSRYL